MAYKRRDRYGLQAPSFRLLIQQTFSGLDPIAHAQLNIAAADRAAYLEKAVFGIIAFVRGADTVPRDVGDSVLEH